MANPFYIEPANPLQALMIGGQAYDQSLKRTQEQALRDAVTAAGPDIAAGNYQAAIAKLGGAGGLQGLMSMAQLQEHAAAAKRAEAQLAESSRHNRAVESVSGGQLELARKQAEEKPQYQLIEDAEGNKRLVQIAPYGAGAKAVDIAGMQPTPTNPYAPVGKLTDEQSKNRLFADRMVNAHKTITDLENINEGVGGFVGGTLAARPFIRDSSAFNLAASPDRQKSIQAQRDFVNALLRKESGAAISQQEFENAQRQYFPMPGDSAAVIEQKRRNRQVAIEGIMQGAGKGYKPPEAYVGTKGPVMPSPGEVRDGYRYKGGNPASPDSWVKVQ